MTESQGIRDSIGDCPNFVFQNGTVPLGTANQRRAAFTLTELLVVITIIAVLAGLITVAVLGALDTAKQTRIKAEVDQLDLAMKSFKDKYGAYPPFYITNSPQSQQALKSFVARAFPRYWNINEAYNDISKVIDTTNSEGRPDQSLVFWLNGVSSDPTHPFEFRRDASQPASPNNWLTKAERKDIFFDFDQSRLKEIGNKPVGATAFSYVPAGSKKNVPYLYFDIPALVVLGATPGNYRWNPGATGDATLAQAGAAPVYGDDSDPLAGFVNKDSCQIIAPGLDEFYGPINPLNVAHMYPSGVGYDPNGNEDDNVTNFCNKPRLGDAKP